MGQTCKVWCARRLARRSTTGIFGACGLREDEAAQCGRVGGDERAYGENGRGAASGVWAPPSPSSSGGNAGLLGGSDAMAGVGGDLCCDAGAPWECRVRGAGSYGDATAIASGRGGAASESARRLAVRELDRGGPARGLWVVSR